MNEIEELIQSMNGESTEEKKISLKEIIGIIKKYVEVLWSKKWIVVAAGLIGAILGYIYAYNRETTYTAHYSFTVGGGSSPAASMGNIASFLNIGGGNSLDAFTGDNVLELLKSPTLIKSTLLSSTVYNGDSISFMEYSLICDSVRAKCAQNNAEMSAEGENTVSICDVEFPIGQDGVQLLRIQDSILYAKAVSLIKNNIAASRRDKKLSFMEFAFSYPNEEFAKRFSEAHLQSVSNFYINTKTALARKNVESFQAKADSVRKNLDQCFSRRAAYSDANRNANGHYAAAAQWKIDTDIQILSATYTEMIKNIEMLKLNLAKETPLIQIIDEPKFPLPNDKMRKLKGIMIGGILAGFLSCAAILGWYVLLEMKRKMEEESTTDNTEE